MNSPEHRNPCLELWFYHVASNPFSVSNAVPNHSGPIFQHHRWLQLQSDLPHESEIFVSHLSVFLGGSLAFQTCEHVLKLPASQIPQMAVPYQVWPAHTALTRDPPLFSNSPRQCNNMNVTSLDRFLQYSYCRLTSRRGFTVQSLSRALPFPLLTDLYCTRKKLLHNLPWPPHEGNALQLRTSKSVCLLKGFYYATIELLGKITKQCVNSVDLQTKLDLRLPPAPQQQIPRILRQANQRFMLTMS